MAPAAGCGACGRGFEPLLAELESLDAEAARCQTLIAELERRRDEVYGELAGVNARRHTVIAALQRRRTELRSRPAPVPIPRDGGGEPAIPAPAPTYRPAAAPPNPAPAPPEASTRSIQTVLLTLGGIVSAAAIIIFTAVAWQTFGDGGRAVILTAFTAAALTAPVPLLRRGLVATAETMSGLGLLLVLCDAVAVTYLGLFADELAFTDPEPMALALLATAIALAYRAGAALTVPGYLVLPFAGCAAALATAQDDVTAGLAGLSAATIMPAAAALLAGVRPAGRSRRADAALPQLAGGATAVLVMVTVLYAAANAPTEPVVLTAAVAAAILVSAAYPLPDRWRTGSLGTAMVLAGLSAVPPVITAFEFTGDALAAAWPAWDGADDLPAATHVTAELAAIAILAALAAALSPRLRPAAGYGGAGLIALAVPAAFGMPLTTAAVAIAGLALLAWLGAIAHRDGPAARFLAGCSMALAVDAAALSATGPGASAIVLTELAAGLAALSCFARGAHRDPGIGIAVWTATGGLAAWLHRADIDPATMVGAMLAAGLLPVVVSAIVAATRSEREPSTPPGAPVPGTWIGLGVLAAGLTATIVSGAMIAEHDLAHLVLPALALAAASPMPFVAVVERVVPARTALATASVAAVLVPAGIAATANPANTLVVHIGLALAVVSLAAVLPRPVGRPIARGGWTVAVAVAGIGAVLAMTAPLAVLRDVDPPSMLDWRIPAVLALAASAILIAPVRGRRGVAADAAMALVILAATTAPAVWSPPWWSAAAIAVAAVAVSALWAPFAPTHGQAVWRLSSAAVLGCYAALAGAYGPAPTERDGLIVAAVSLGAVLACCALVAVLSREPRSWTGVAVTATALAVLPAAATVSALAADWAGDQIRLAAMGATACGLLVAALLCAAGSRLERAASPAVGPIATIVAVLVFDGETGAFYLACAGLIGVAAALLAWQQRPRLRMRSALAAPALVAGAVPGLPMVGAAIVLPYRWLDSVWQRTPASTVDGLAPTRPSLPGGEWELAALAVAAAAIILLVFALAGQTAAMASGIVACAVTLPGLLLVIDPPWPTLPLTCIGVAAVAWLVTALSRLRGWPSAALSASAAVFGASGLAGALAAEPVTVLALAIAVLTATVTALFGVDDVKRIAGWQLTALFGVLLAVASGLAAGLSGGQTGLGVLAVAALLLAAAAMHAGTTAAVNRAVELAGHAAAATAVGFAAGSAGTAATVLALYAALLGLLTLRAAGTGGTDHRPALLGPRTAYAWCAVASVTAAYWLLLVAADVTVAETYTVPVALLTVGGGWLELRRRHHLRSWIAFGPGLLVGLLPSLAQVVLSGEQPYRRLVLGAAALAVLLLGVWRRYQAPVTVGGGVLLAVAVNEVALLWRHVPTWAPLALAGALLLVLGATFEQRRRDLRRLRTGIAAMR